MAVIGKDIEQAKHFLHAGELVGIPTETVYGLAANALNIEAVTKIFSVKDRPSFDPLIVHVASFRQALEYATDIPDHARLLATRFWPGPLTLLLEKKVTIPDLVTAGLTRVGLRCPDHELTLALLQHLPFPLAAPSANPFGYVSPTTAQHVADQLGDRIPYILDGGPCKVGIESTVLGWESGKPVIYRSGGITIEQIESVIGKVGLQPYSTSNPHSPGQLRSHYAPKKKFLLGDIHSLSGRHKPKNPGILSFRYKVSDIPSGINLVLSPAGDLAEAARNLFSMLRQLDSSDIDLVLAEEVPDTGLGRAINDRLRRAAAEV